MARLDSNSAIPYIVVMGLSLLFMFGALFYRESRVQYRCTNGFVYHKWDSENFWKTDEQPVKCFVEEK
jgi:hypothetical protein